MALVCIDIKIGTMKIKHVLMSVLCACCLGGCYDDGELWDAVNGGQRMEALEEWQRITGSNVEALHVLANVTGCVAGVTPVVLGGETIGYTVWLDDRTSTTLYKGRGSVMPVVSLAQGDDEKWYWTLNGEPVKDVRGSFVCASEKDDGGYVPNPQLKVGRDVPAGITADTENRLVDEKSFYLSVDGGSSWTAVSGSDKKGGQSPFAGVTDKEGSVEIVMNDAAGSMLRLFKNSGAKVIFETNENGNIELTDPNHLTIAYRTENMDDDSWLFFEGTNGLSVLDNEDGTVTLVPDELRSIDCTLIVTIVRRDRVVSKVKYMIEIPGVLADVKPEYYKTAPDVLEAIGGKVPVTISGSFPVCWFDMNAIVTVTPFLRWSGGEVEGLTLVFQGEAVKGEGQTVSFLWGGTFTMKASFNYVPEMAKSELYLEISIRKGASTAVQSVKIANGVISAG